MGKLNWVTKACATLLLWAIAAVALPAQTAPTTSAVPVFTSLHNFDFTDGLYPTAGLVQGANGNFYGTTSAGGNDTCDSVNGCGTVFSITTGGVLTSLFLFDYSDGESPVAGLVLGTTGKFYGTVSNAGTGGGDGTVFSITASGRLTTLHGFDQTDGKFPSVALVQGTTGNFYGTTLAGGKSNSGCTYYGCGTIFEITPGGALTTLYKFCSQIGCADGSEPEAGLVEGTDGNFYGTTALGGAYGWGTVFKITSGGTLTTLYSFCSQGGEYCTDGAEPKAGLVLGTDGNFYGTTSAGGNSSSACNSYPLDCGTVFKITPSGALTTLYMFCSLSNCADGAAPSAGLVQGTDGNFYGTTMYGGANDVCISPLYYEKVTCGTLFEVTAGGTLSTLHSFDGTDGDLPEAGLVQATDGTFYGTTWGGGVNVCNLNGYGCGTVFSLSVGLGSFVETNPVAGKVGAAVGILGTDLTGATDVTFNGTATAFRVVSSTFIEAKVPSGATTGAVQVQLPSGTLSSNVPFIVLP